MAATGWECGVEALELGVCSWRSSSIDGQFRKKDWKGRLELCQGVVNILPYCLPYVNIFLIFPFSLETGEHGSFPLFHSLFLSLKTYSHLQIHWIGIMISYNKIPLQQSNRLSQILQLDFTCL